MVSTLIGAVLVAAAIVWPRATGTDVFIYWPPMKARWTPDLAPTLVLPVLVALAGFLTWRLISAALKWAPYLAAVFAGSWLWTAALAHVGGTESISKVFARPSEYFVDAKEMSSIPAFLSGFIERVPLDAPGHWPIHIAGHPPGATIFFILLDRIGISDPYTAGVIVMTLGCTGVVAVLLTVKTLASEKVARRAAPWLIAAPSAIWMGVSADALFTAVGAWGLALLALSSTAERRSRLIGFGLPAGLLLGLCVYLSYGLLLLGILAVAVIFLGGRWSTLLWALGGALSVAVAFTLAGFRWWEGFPVLVTRYYDGIQSKRQYGYWVWANLGAWTFTSGLAVWAAFPRSIVEAWRGADKGRRVVAVLGCAGFVSILVATLSGMSKAEVERIWLPFTIWVLVLPSLLPLRWQRPLLVTQVASAIAIETLLTTQW
ncbi:hypothetical protein SAMN04489751_3000 [Brevibacterium sandarakinum]|uniref:Integral membrane protein n=1 Tax=Brevibacterium sandarakinum TaxID=629680 RepID=A0A1H1VFR7_BRESA|nr:hypothetical protein SAMN04489751_3000 [Brevibacterium sandarakinum]